MKMISDQGDSLAHYGIPGMRWGKSGVRKSLGSMEKGWNKAIDRQHESSKKFKEMAKNTTDKAKQDKLNAKAKRYENAASENKTIVSKITKAKKLTDGMNMSQAVSTMQKAAGWSKGKSIMNKLLYSSEMNLTFATLDYALNGK